MLIRSKRHAVRFLTSKQFGVVGRCVCLDFPMLANLRLNHLLLELYIWLFASWCAIVTLDSPTDISITCKNSWV
ncbi:hypothetical protein BDP27DRAFT_1276270, partial [Rhodocollybia butyracea]